MYEGYLTPTAPWDWKVGTVVFRQDRWPLLSSPVLELGLISWLVPTVPASSLYTSSPIITYSAPGCLCSKVLAFSGSIAHCLLYASSLSDR